MRKSILLLGIASLTMASAYGHRIAVPANDFNPWSVDRNSRIENPLYPQTIAERNTPTEKSFFAKKQNVPFKAGEADGKYFVAAQRYYEGYSFVYEGGDISTYYMTVDVDGENVTIKGLFNMVAQSTEWNVCEDYEIVGKYNKEESTLTIPTKPNFDEGTIVGSAYGGYYQELLIAGTVTESREIETVDDLVFNVIGDFEALTTDTDFGIMNCSSTGDMYGIADLYRGFYATIPQTEPKLIVFDEVFNVGEEFATMKREKTLSIVNVSESEVNFFVDLESDGDVFSVSDDYYTVSPLSSYGINILFLPKEAGKFSADLTIEYGGNQTEPDPLNVVCEGTGVAMPDFDKIVKNGDFSFQTNIDYPFQLVTLDNGSVVAMSSCSGKGYVSSLFTVEFEVPADHIATFSWKGNVSMEMMNNAVAGYYIDDSDYPAVTLYNSDAIDNSVQFGPGKHSVRYEFFNANNSGSDGYFMYLYDLDLVTIEAEKEAVKVDNANITLPNQLIKDNSIVMATGIVDVRNMGKTPITISDVTLSDTEHFSTYAPNEEATLYEVLPVNVNFNTNEPGQYSTIVDITTNCGKVSAEVKVLVRKMADFSSVIAEGMQYVTSIETSDTDPFDVKDGVAFNANTGMDDDEPTTSWFQINFTIPEGVKASIAWAGDILSSESKPDPLNSMDYGMIDIYNSSFGGGTIYTNDYEGEAGSLLFEEIVDGFAYLLNYNGPADGYVKFTYIKNGDGINENEDIMQIYDFSIFTESSGIKSNVSNATAVATEIFSINGIRLQHAQKGVNIIRTTYSDGTIKTNKIIVE